MCLELPFESAAGVAVQIYDARHQLARSDVRLIVTALKFEVFLVWQFDVCSLDLQTFCFEDFGAFVKREIPSI